MNNITEFMENLSLTWHLTRKLHKVGAQSSFFFFSSCIHRKSKIVPFGLYDEQFLPSYSKCSLSELGLRSVSLKSRRRPEHRGNIPSLNNNLRLIFQPGLYEAAFRLLRENLAHYHTVLDIGCGSLFFQSSLYPGDVPFRRRFEADQTALIGLDWVPFEPSPSSLVHGIQFDIARNGKLPFRSGLFDCIVSISVLQWLFCERHDVTKSLHNVNNFLKELHRCSSPNSETVIQFYPSSLEDLVLVFDLAKKKFYGGLVVEYPFANRGAKLFLYLRKIQ